MKKIPPPLKIRLIVNPTAGRDLAGRELSRITRAFAAEGITDIVKTERAGDESRLAAEAIASGIGTIVAIGGDGTCSRIAATIVTAGSSCRLGLVPVGTGNDFAKTLGVVSLSFPEIAGLCAGSSIARMDVGKIDDIYFLNGCGFGIDPEILAAALSVTWLRGNAVYIVSALRKLFSYGGVTIGTSTPGGVTQTWMMLTVSNGRNLGGAFKIAPLASVCDGCLDVHSFADARPARRLKIFLATMQGRHPELPEVSFERHSSLTLTFLSPPAMEIDGELRHARSSSVSIECLPGALSVVAAPGFPL
ncbi:MAG: YegS/Rv2252/BmrU family lipid kinase [Gemmatimonadaceae bacterium]|nr:YegS/Rv2252/BmrU family lipid kinase [Gemmatimonadaceae bacterium]